MVHFKKTLTILAFLWMGMGSAMAGVNSDEQIVAEPFRGETRGSKLSINYDDFSAILKQTVVKAGHSDRRYSTKAPPAAGSRVTRGSTKSTRLEGNRIDFHSYLGENLATLVRLRDDIASVPTILPLSDMSRNEQLSYWLNLYNLTLITQVVSIFPESNLKKFHSSRNKRQLWEEKVITVAGVPLSLNDIQFKVILPKFHNPLVMYGLFQGVIGGPNIRDEAFTGDKVWKQLEDNAREFVNSNRGARVRNKKLQVSVLYETNAALFPDFQAAVGKHIHAYAKPRFQQQVTAGIKVKVKQKNWDIADLYAGHKGTGSAANTNGAALLGAIRSGGAGGAGASSGGEQGGAIASAWIGMMQSHNMSGTRFPAHVVEFLHRKERRDRKMRVGEVGVEEQVPDKETEETDDVKPK